MLHFFKLLSKIYSKPLLQMYYTSITIVLGETDFKSVLFFGENNVLTGG